MTEDLMIEYGDPLKCRICEEIKKEYKKEDIKICSNCKHCFLEASDNNYEKTCACGKNLDSKDPCDNWDDYMKFKIGDRITCISEYEFKKSIINKTGTVIKVNSEHSIGVEFDDKIDGHNCDGLGKNLHCWYIPESNLKLKYSSCWEN